jgi:hypothetical protein
MNIHYLVELSQAERSKLTALASIRCKAKTQAGGVGALVGRKATRLSSKRPAPAMA